ncbi:hypothetical protein ACFL4W_00750 [Planctomycetota bacterium]
MRCAYWIFLLLISLSLMWCACGKKPASPPQDTPAPEKSPPAETPTAPEETAPQPETTAIPTDPAPDPAAVLKTEIESVAKRAQEVPWTPRGLSGGGGMYCPGISPANPELMMINCDMSGAYISENGGRDWRMINCNEHRTSTRCYPAFHPTEADTIYAATGRRINVSKDRGRTWEQLFEFEQGPQGKIIINHDNPAAMLIGLRDGSVMRSADTGKSWAACQGLAGIMIDAHFDRTTKGKSVLIATDKGIWRSDDGGGAWVEKTNGLPWKEIQGFAGGSNAKDNLIMLYVTVKSKDQDGTFAGGVFRSKDKGETWESAMGQGTNRDLKMTGQWGAGKIAQYKQVMCPDVKPMTVYMCNSSTGFNPPQTDTVYRSDDGGRTWRLTFFEDPRFEQYNVAPNWGTASTGQCYKGGGAPFGITVCETDPERILLTRGYAMATHDGGTSWFNAHCYPPEGVTPGKSTPWVCNGLVITTTWHYYVDPFEDNRHYIAYTDLGWARSLDKGKTWIWWTQQTWTPWRNTCYEIAFDPEIPGKMWGAFSNVHDIPNDNIISERHGSHRPGGLCISKDFGESWGIEAQEFPAKPVTSIVLDPGSPKGSRTLYAGVFDVGVMKSTDDGKTWTVKKNGLGHEKNMRVYRVILHKDGTLFAIICARRPAQRKPLMPEGVGLYRSKDKGENWEKINASQPLLYVKDFEVHPENSNHILMGACNTRTNPDEGGLYRTKDGGQTWARIGKEARQTFGGYFHPKYEGWIYMTLTEGASGAGLWLSRDDGRTWQPFMDLPFANIQRVTFDPDNDAAITVTTFGGSVWHGPVVPHS